MAASSTKIVCRYFYSPLDQLMGVSVLDRTSTQLFYQANYLTTELGPQTQRTIIRNEAQPLAQQHVAAGVTETTLLATDQANSPLLTLSQNSTRKLAYTVYGHRPMERGSNPIPGYVGEDRDEITGHYSLGQGNRFFNTVLMRFNSPDKLGPFDKSAGINTYAYCGDDPINFVDPNGNARFSNSLSARPRTPINPARQTLNVVGPTSRAIGRDRIIHQNPLLNEMLERTSNASRPAPRAPASTPKLSEFHELPSGISLKNNRSTLSPQELDLQNFEASYDYNKSKQGFKTMITDEDLKALSANKKLVESAEDPDIKARLKHDGLTIALRIKKTSVSHYYIQQALNKVRQSP